MPFSQQKLEQVRAGIEQALSSSSLNDWERRFLQDMRARLQRDGQKTRLTEKQYRKLMQLAGIDRSRGPSASTQAHPKSTPRPRPSPIPRMPRAPRLRYPRPYRALSPSRIVRRAERDVSFLAYGAVMLVVIAIFGVFSGGNHSTTSTPLQVASSDSTGASTQLSGRSIRVIDGDTVAVPGESRHIRLVGFNAPEVFSPKCNRELRIGQQATQRLRQLLTSAATVEYERVACSCKPGTEGTKRCNYGRLCGVLRVDGRDTGEMLIAEGLAVRYQCGRYGCPPKPGNWCNG